MNYHIIEYYQNIIDDLLCNWPKFKPAYRESKKYKGLIEIVKSKECKRYIKNIEKIRTKQDVLLKEIGILN